MESQLSLTSWFFPTTKLDARTAAFETKLKSMRGSSPSDSGLLVPEKDSERDICKTFVWDRNSEWVDNTGVTIIGTYGDSTSSTSFQECKWWEGARATCATPRVFSPITIRDRYDQRYEAPGFSHDNPARHVWREAVHLFGQDEVRDAVLLSIGPPTSSDCAFSPDIHGQTNKFKYFRLDNAYPDPRRSDPSVIEADMHNYLNREEVKRNIRVAAHAFTQTSEPRPPPYPV